VTKLRKIRFEWGGGARGKYGKQQRYTQSFGGETQGKDHQEDLGVYGKPINTDPEGTR